MVVGVGGFTAHRRVLREEVADVSFPLSRCCKVCRENLLSYVAMIYPEASSGDCPSLFFCFLNVFFFKNTLLFSAATMNVSWGLFLDVCQASSEAACLHKIC